MKQKKIVCISGMERSGTSMVSRIVNLLGVYLGGEDDLIMETEYNLKGCWENKTLLKISDEILSRFGGDTHEIPDFAEGWTDDPRIADLEAEARKIIGDEFSNYDAWGWKDTRCSLIMPFWQKLLPEMEYVICIRNPSDVAHSVVTRKWTSSFTEAYCIWHMYTSNIIRHTAGKRRIFVFYEDFMGKDHMAEVRRLAKFLGPRYVRRMNKASSEIEAFITKGLQHHETTLMATLKDV
ncbi:MAG: sulfotransferase family protein, partial [Thermodesulfobacteriota bacterium]